MLEMLFDDSSKTLLIYSSYISKSKLSIKKYKNKDKKNYIDKKGINETLHRGFYNLIIVYNELII